MTNGFPAISRSIFRDSRVEAMRAGMTARVFIFAYSFVFCRCLFNGAYKTSFQLPSLERHVETNFSPLLESNDRCASETHLAARVSLFRARRHGGAVSSRRRPIFNPLPADAVGSLDEFAGRLLTVFNNDHDSGVELSLGVANIWYARSSLAITS